MIFLIALAVLLLWYASVALAIRRVPAGTPLPLAGSLPRWLALLLSPLVLLLGVGVLVLWGAYGVAVGLERFLTPEEGQ